VDCLERLVCLPWVHPAINAREGLGKKSPQFFLRTEKNPGRERLTRKLEKSSKQLRSEYFLLGFLIFRGLLIAVENSELVLNF
jgi:hypothetical protein